MLCIDFFGFSRSILFWLTRVGGIHKAHLMSPSCQCFNHQPTEGFLKVVDWSVGNRGI